MSKKNELMTTGALVTTAEVEHCNRLHAVATGLAEEARATAERACHYAVILGLRLKRLKEATPHGGWNGLFQNGRYVEGEAKAQHVALFGFSESTARNYMRAAEGALNRPGLTDKKRREIEGIAATDAAELGKDDHELLDLATKGETLRQLYLDLGVIRAGATEKRTERSAPPKKTPGVSEEDDVYMELVGASNTITRLLTAGKLSLLTPGRVRELMETWQSFVDDAKPLARG